MINIRSKVYLKFFISYFLLTIFLIGSIGFLLYINSIRNLEKEISLDMVSRLKYVQSVVEERLVKQAEQELFARSSNYLNKLNFKMLFANNASDLDIYQMYEIYDDFQELLKANAYIHSATMFFVHSGSVVSSEQGLILDSERFFDRDFVQGLKTQSIGFSGQWSGMRTLSAAESRVQPVKVATYAMVFPYSAKGEQIMAYLYVNIYESALREMLATFSKMKSEGIYILDKGGNLVTAVNSSEEQEKAVLSVSREPGENFKILQQGNARWMISYNFSPKNGWYYVITNPVKDFYRLSNDITRAMVVVCLIASMFGIMLSFIFSNRFYIPIREIASYFTKPEYQKQEGDEYRVIHDNIREMNHTIGELQTRLKDQIYLDYLHGRDPQFTGNAPHEPAAYGKMLVLILSFSHQDTRKAESFAYTVKQTLGTFMEVFTISESPTELLVVLAYDCGYDRVISLLKGEVREKLEAEGAIFCVAVGDEVSDLASLHVSCENAREASRYKFIHWKNNVIEYKDIEAYGNFEVPDVFASFEAALKSCNLKMVRHVFAVFMQRIEEGVYTIESIEHAFLQIIAAINQVILEMNLQKHLVSHKNIYHEFFNKVTIYEAVQWIFGICENVADLIRERGQNAHSREIMSKIREYIDHHLHTDISLDTLSDISLLSPTYISSQFKEVFNMGFSEYLNELRLTRAA